MFCYSFNTACDKNGFILENHVSSGNVHDSKNFEHIFKKVTSKFESIKAVAVDAGYVTPFIAKTISDNGSIPVFPYKRPMTKKGFFKRYEFVYDEYLDIYICPSNKDLKYSTTDRDGYKNYKSDPNDCISCHLKDRCTMSKNNQKVINRHVWIEYLEEANHLRHTPYNKKIYKQRAETIERVFADAKEKHGMRYTQLRGLGKVETEATLIFTCMNLKKMASWLWKKAA